MLYLFRDVSGFDPLTPMSDNESRLSEEDVINLGKQPKLDNYELSDNERLIDKETAEKMALETRGFQDRKYRQGYRYREAMTWWERNPRKRRKPRKPRWMMTRAEKVADNRRRAARRKTQTQKARAIRDAAEILGLELEAPCNAGLHELSVKALQEIAGPGEIVGPALDTENRCRACRAEYKRRLRQRQFEKKHGVRFVGFADDVRPEKDNFVRQEDGSPLWCPSENVRREMGNYNPIFSYPQPRTPPPAPSTANAPDHDLEGIL